MNTLHPACKVTLVRKTSAKCDFSQAMLSIAYKLNCTLQSEMHDVTVRRHAHSSGEYASEVEGTAPCYSSERGEALAAGIINRVAPEGRHLEVAYELAAEVAKNPPLSVRATVRTRRWYMDQLEREVTMQTAPLKLYLSEDFQEAARAFAEKRKPGPFKGR